MVARGAGDVGCAHCTQFGARETCQVCGLQVCETCAADWTTCSAQASRELRLGLGWRLRDVDPKGRYALVSRVMKAPHIVDLRQLRWLGETPLVINATALMARYPPRLTSDGLLAYADISIVDGAVRHSGMRYREMLGGSPNVGIDSVEGPLGGCTCVSAVGDWYAHVTESQRVVVLTHDRNAPAPDPQAATVVGYGALSSGPVFRCVTRSYEPLPRKVVSAIAIDSERELLASATWREIAIHKMVEDKLERFAYLDTGIDANISWLALTGRWLAYGTQSRVYVRSIDEHGAIGEVHYQHQGRIETAAISRDGAYLAVAHDSMLSVVDLVKLASTEFDEHSDGINYVRFGSEDHMLISGDQDNRVMLRPRTEAGYAHPVVRVELSGDR
jgi:hypothetical protein